MTEMVLILAVYILMIKICSSDIFYIRDKYQQKVKDCVDLYWGNRMTKAKKLSIDWFPQPALELSLEGQLWQLWNHQNMKGNLCKRISVQHDSFIMSTRLKFKCHIKIKEYQELREWNFNV